MARPLRLEFAEALYHVTSRGNRCEPIYENDEDRVAFLTVLAGVIKQFNWRTCAYGLMGNHYHLLIETPDGNLAQGMRQLNGVYNAAQQSPSSKSGHLFQGRYKAILVQKASYLLELSRYIVSNPVRVFMVRSAGDWPRSSYRATAGRVSSLDWLTTVWILSAFGQRSAANQFAYRRFVSEGRGQTGHWENLVHQVLWGDEVFIDEMRGRIEQLNQPLKEVPWAQRARRVASISNYKAACGTRDEAIQCAYASDGYRMQEIGRHCGLHYSRIRRIVKAVERQSKNTKA